jgi:hypothetical protein
MIRRERHRARAWPHGGRTSARDVGDGVASVLRTQMRRRALLGAALAFGLTGCVGEDLGGSFLIVNEWDRPIFYLGVEIAPGGSYRIGVRTCGRPGMTLKDERDDILVRLEEEWCAGQTLTVRGPGDFTLEPAATE